MEQVVAAEPRQAQPERAVRLQGLVRKQAGATVPWRRGRKPGTADLSAIGPAQDVLMEGRLATGGTALTWPTIEIVQNPTSQKTLRL